MNLVEVRCPLPHIDFPEKTCDALCLWAEPGSSGKVLCRRHKQHFEFHVDSPDAISDIKAREA